MPKGVKQYKSNNNNKNAIVEEPLLSYKTMKLKRFENFEVMEQNRLVYFASLAPEELLRNLKKLSMAAFGIKDETELKKPDRLIKFNQ